ncbi:MAG: DUF362 domain-containing protein [candidate division WOR-3 bacterium]
MRITRRDFLKKFTISTAGIFFVPKLFAEKYDKTGKLIPASDVIWCSDVNATSGSTINQSVVQIMIDTSIKRLTGQTTVGAAWLSLFPGITTSSIICIKVNCINSLLPSHRQVVEAVINGLAQMNIGGQNFIRNNVIVWDRTNGELTNSGYTIYTGNDPARYRVFGSDQSGVGYDTSRPLTIQRDSGSTTANPSRIMTSLSNYMINIACLKDHGAPAMTLCLKNNFGTISPIPCYDDNSPEIPSVNQQIRDVLNKFQRIYIVDGLFGIYNGGPGGSPQSWLTFAPKNTPDSIFMSRDPVAIDYQCEQIINAERARRGLYTKNALHIRTASQPPYNLGTMDINLIRIQNPSGIEEKSSGSVNGLKLYQNQPNPFNVSTVIRYKIRNHSQVTLQITDGVGRVIKVLTDKIHDPGSFEIVWDGRDARGRRVAAGTYIYTLKAGNHSIAKSLTIVNPGS